MEKSLDSTVHQGGIGGFLRFFFSNSRLCMTFLVLALFIPLFFHGFRVGLPHVKAGDEPHYLVMLNSLLQDGDWDLMNNYDSVWNGSNQAGKKFAGFNIDPHIWCIVDGKVIPWNVIFSPELKMEKLPNGRTRPVMAPGYDYSKIHGAPLHPYGMPFLASLLIWPFKNTIYVEPLALFLANLAIIFSAFIFRRILSRYTQDEFLINISTFVVFLGTPLWAYGRTFFNEPFLVFFGLAGYWIFLERNSGFWTGVLLGLGLFIKPTLCLFLFPVALVWLLRKDWGNILRLGIGPAVVFAFYLYTNYTIFGKAGHFVQDYSPGNIFWGSLGLWFSWNHSILAFTPMAIFVVVAWKRFFQDHKQEALLWVGAFLCYFLFMANLAFWDGSWSYGPREIVPILPILMIPTFYCFESFPRWNKWMRWVFIVLCLLSLAFNSLGAMDGYWASHPLTIFAGNVS